MPLPSAVRIFDLFSLLDAPHMFTLIFSHHTQIVGATTTRIQDRTSMSSASWLAPCADCRELTLRISQGLACTPLVAPSPPVSYLPHPPRPALPARLARPARLALPSASQCLHLLFQMCPHVPVQGRSLRRVHAQAAEGPVVVGAVGARVSRLLGGPKCQIYDVSCMYVTNVCKI